MIRRFIQTKIFHPFSKFLAQGVSIEEIALGMSVGVVLGIFPIIGSTTLLCAMAAFLFKLNLPIIQLVNYLVYPLQIVLLIPFYQIGAWVFGVEPLPLSVTQLVSMFRTDPWSTFVQLWDSTGHALLVWGLICLPTVAGLYLILNTLLRLLSPKFLQSKA